MTPELSSLLKKYSEEDALPFTSYLKLRKRDLEEFPAIVKDKLANGYVLVANEDAIERMIYAKTFHSHGMYTFVLEEPKDEKDGLIAIAPLQNDLEAILWVLTGYDIEETMPIDIVKELAKWRDYCAFRLTGAGVDWVKLDFETLPNDINGFAKLILELSPALEHFIGNENEITQYLQEERKITLKWKYSF